MYNYRILFCRALVLASLVAPTFAASSPKYLALGDSISFGYHPPPPALPPSIDNYVGYPEILDPLVPKQELNLSCPGQTSGSFLTGKGDTEVPPQNCEIVDPFPGWKAIGYPLHVNYTGPQADYAVKLLKNNPSIDLVTISLGGNDLLRVQSDCGGPTAPGFAACVITNLPVALAKYGTNLATILTRLRVEANYKDTIVLVKYFATSTDPLVKQAIGALNQAMERVGRQFGAKMADPFTAFQIASIPYGGDPCKAGLLARLDAHTCDVHPTRLGQAVIATTVIIAIFSR